MDNVLKNQAIRKLCPTLNFMMSNNDVIVLDDGTLPSDADIAAELVLIKNIYAFEQLRLLRNNLLNSSDKYMITDYPITSEAKALWTTYRQALRVLPDNLVGQTLDVSNLNSYFPTPPS